MDRQREASSNHLYIYKLSKAPVCSTFQSFQPLLVPIHHHLVPPHHERSCLRNHSLCQRANVPTRRHDLVAKVQGWRLQDLWLTACAFTSWKILGFLASSEKWHERLNQYCIRRHQHSLKQLSRRKTIHSAISDQPPLSQKSSCQMWSQMWQKNQLVFPQNPKSRARIPNSRDQPGVTFAWTSFFSGSFGAPKSWFTFSIQAPAELTKASHASNLSPSLLSGSTQWSRCNLGIVDEILNNSFSLIKDWIIHWFKPISTKNKKELQPHSFFIL